MWIPTPWLASLRAPFQYSGTSSSGLFLLQHDIHEQASGAGCEGNEGADLVGTYWA